jgi:hypothetical protein
MLPLLWVVRGFPQSLQITDGIVPLLDNDHFFPDASNYSRISQNFMEPEGSLPYSEEPLTGSYLKPDHSSPYHPNVSL